ncbi:LysR family transcriptional regulator [Ottowia caeni]|uniref:LysR family transcriptional regulator n=1 Tax=Ottowia caeni TaxID=2870339 RepID=UPI001E43F928|nr:LysR family transcriptional regulator [Ottowia caeni]
MDEEKFDLNLLNVFDALMTDGNLTRAGFRLGLSQPAMSHSLAKLRKLTGDPLFVRVPKGMLPTEYAIRIAPSVREGLRLLSGAISADEGFNPQSCQRTFQILMSDIGEMIYLPRLMAKVSSIATGVNIRVLQLPRESYAQAFLSGEADLAIGFLPNLGAGFYQQRLFSDSYVCLVRENHPRVRTRLSLTQFEQELHVLTEPGGSRYSTISHQTSTTTLIEQYLTTHKLTRRVALRVPHFLVVPAVVQASDLIATLPSAVIRYSATVSGVKMVQLPFAAPSFEVKQFWHERNHDDAGNRWLRGVIRDLFSQNGGEPPHVETLREA